MQRNIWKYVSFKFYFTFKLKTLQLTFVPFPTLFIRAALKTLTKPKKIGRSDNKKM
jgi:hypothetical protein